MIGAARPAAPQRRELLDIFDAEGVDSAFVFTFESTQLPHRPDGDPRDDLDRASYGIVKVLEGGRGETYRDMRWGTEGRVCRSRRALRIVGHGMTDLPDASPISVIRSDLLRGGMLDIVFPSVRHIYDDRVRPPEQDAPEALR